MKAPRNKTEFYRRWHQGEFGNKLAAWNSYGELIDSGYRGSVSIRSIKWSETKTQYSVPFCQIECNIQSVMKIPLSDCQFNESAPDDLLIGQGELLIHTCGYYLFWSYDRLPMRKALAKSGKEYTGLMALGILKAYCNPKSYSMLQELIELYQGAAIEFGVYTCNVGDWPGNNTIIWEVRGY